MYFLLKIRTFNKLRPVLFYACEGKNGAGKTKIVTKYGRIMMSSCLLQMLGGNMYGKLPQTFRYYLTKASLAQSEPQIVSLI